MRTLATREVRQRLRRSLWFDLALAVLFGFAAALAKRYLDFSLGIPGHAGVGWIAVLVAGRLTNSRFGMATVSGVSMAFWGVPVGLNHSLAYNTLLYGLAGSVLDSGMLLKLPLRKWWASSVAGVLVHLSKFGYVIAHAWLSGILKRIEIYGFLAGLRNHIIFGALGGAVGWALWRAGGSVAAWLRARRVS